MATYYDQNDVEIRCGDAFEVLRELPASSADCCVTSPPYWGLRDYGVEGQLGLEPTPEKYVSRMVEVFREVRRVLRDDGTLWLNLGDAYGGKRLVGIPWRVAFALQADGWYLRSDIIWHKPNPMPESVTDRPTKSHEYLFLLSKSASYHYDAEAIAEPCGGFNGSTFTHGKTAEARQHLAAIGQGERIEPDHRNKRSVWTVATQAFPEAHFATFPEALIEPCIKAGCPSGGTVLDPFGGSGTTAVVARKLWRRAVLIELNEAYCEMAVRRVESDILPMEAAWGGCFPYPF